MASLPSGLPDFVEDGEDLARFLTSSSQFNTLIVKPAAFMPKDGQASVFRHGPEPRDSLWQIAIDHAVGDRTLHGAAVVSAGEVRAASLDVAASEPPPRHANIIGWASSGTDPEAQKAQQMAQAILLASRAVLWRR